MSVLVDTSVWSGALRKENKAFSQVFILQRLVEDGLVKIIGPIRQELLSGITDNKKYEALKRSLSHFSDIPLQTPDFEKGAEFYNHCRKKGIQGSHIDFLICALAYTHDLQIFTMDKDFAQFQKILPIKLFE